MRRAKDLIDEKKRKLDAQFRAHYGDSSLSSSPSPIADNSTLGLEMRVQQRKSFMNVSFSSHHYKKQFNDPKDPKGQKQIFLRVYVCM
jgi:hypothetical protein